MRFLPRSYRGFYIFRGDLMEAVTAVKAARVLVTLKNNKRLINIVMSVIGLIILFLGLVIMLTVSMLTSMLNISTGFRSGSPTNTAKFEVPGNLMTVFSSAQEKYGVSWAVLAAIAKIESSFGANMSESSAGAIGFMQFMPDTWEQYKQDGNGDGEYDPCNPWDAVYSAANYLKASGFEKDPSKAIYAYNHAWWYVKRVLDLSGTYATNMVPIEEGVWPVPGHNTITDNFGPRIHPLYKTLKNHYGIDIGAPMGAPVVAAVSGRVTMARANAGYGLCVKIANKNCQTVYGHLSDFAVRAGDDVTAGQTIGYVGSTGVSTGPHLHFEVLLNGRAANPVEWLKVPTANN